MIKYNIRTYTRLYMELRRLITLLLFLFLMGCTSQMETPESTSKESLFEVTVDESHTSDNSPANASKDVRSERALVYFVPQDQSLIHERFAPQSLELASALEAVGLSMFVSFDWAETNRMLADGTAQALLIHFEAQEMVDVAQLRQRAAVQNVAVGAIGIEGLVLAEMLGVPSLFTSVWGDAGYETYTTPHFYYVYAFDIEGDEADIQALIDAGWQPGENSAQYDVEISKPLSISGGAATDSLLYSENGLENLFTAFKTKERPSPPSTPLLYLAAKDEPDPLLASGAVETHDITIANSFDELKSIKEARPIGGAIIIHQSRFDEVDKAWLRVAYNQQTVIAGINITMSELAEAVGGPSSGWSEGWQQETFFSLLTTKGSSYSSTTENIYDNDFDLFISLIERDISNPPELTIDN